MRELNITYTTDTSNWEDWQRDYRLGLILIVPLPMVSTLIDSLRTEYDPRSAAICQSHIRVRSPTPVRTRSCSNRVSSQWSQLTHVGHTLSAIDLN